MRILHTADWHLGKTLEGRSRLPEQEQLMDELVEIVRDERIDVLLMAGDVFDSVNPPAMAEQLFYESLARLSDNGKREIIVIAGNHDHPDRLIAARSLVAKQGITLLGYPQSTGLTFTVSSCQQQLQIAALPYPSESRLKQLLEERAEEEHVQVQYDQRIRELFADLTKGFHSDSVNIAMSHLFVAGGTSSDSERPIQVGGAYTVLEDSLPENAQYIALGHLHRPQTLRKAKALTRYAGSPLAYSFSEAGTSKSVTILDIEPGEAPHFSEIYLRSGKPLVHWKAKEGLHQVYQWLEEGRDREAWIDLELFVDHALSFEEIHRLRHSHTGLIHIRPHFESSFDQEERVSHAELPIQEVFKRFYERQSGGATPEDKVVELFLELLQANEDEGEEAELAVKRGSVE